MIYKRGKKGTYWFRFRFAGRIIHESTKSRLKTLARDAERERRRELEQKYNHVEKRKLPPTISQACNIWIEKRNVGAGTRETYEAALKHIKAKLGRALVCDIEARHIAAYQRARLSESAAGATINKEICCLSSILAEYGIWDAVRREVNHVEENQSAGRALSLEQEKWLLACACNIGQRQGGRTPLYTVTVLALNTGLRHTEVRRLRWQNIDLENRVLIVGVSKTDAGRNRPVPLTQPAWAVLEMWASRFPGRRSEHYIFPACENGEIHPLLPISNWRTAWRRVTRLIQCPKCQQVQNPAITCQNEACAGDIRNIKSSIAGLRFHDLRHTAATKLLEHGTPFAVVAQILGWSASTAVRMAKRYGHIRPEVQRRALEAITTPEIQKDVNQIVNQLSHAVEWQMPNRLILQQ